jgi:prepilin-type N-terminal cleavage/methylation domain-containing protein
MNEHKVMVNIPGGGAEYFDLTTRSFSARAGRAHVGTDAKSAPFLRLGVARSARRRAGFTLVEVIVVLVILAILAAIAIPALTGYIAKAQDEQYIAQARNASVAIKTVLNEEYASGKLDGISYFTQGNEIGLDSKLVSFEIDSISGAVNNNDFNKFFSQAAALIGEAYPTDSLGSGFWTYISYAQKGSGATAATADGFGWELYPEGNTSDVPLILVTYKLERITASESTYSAFYNFVQDNGVYDPNAGYEVYHLIN